MSFYTLGIMGTTPIGGLIAGWVIDAVDPRAALALGGASALVSGVVCLLLVRRSPAPAPITDGASRVASS
jgi:hypothetical protein